MIDTNGDTVTWADNGSVAHWSLLLPARLTYPSVKSLRSAKTYPKSHHGNLQYIQVSMHCGAKCCPRDHHGNLQLYISTTIAYIYTLSKCQRTKRHPKDHHNDGWSMIIRSSSRWQSNINLMVSGRLLEVWVCCYFCPFLTSFNQVSLKITKTIVNAEGICPRYPRNRI